MKIAFINQPFDKVRPPFQSSLGIWTYEVARRLARDHEVLVYVRGGRLRFGELFEDGARYRFVPTAIDRRLQALLETLPVSRDSRRPRFASAWYHRAYASALARDLRRQECDVAHILNFSQFVPPIRGQNPDLSIVLHMQCDWLAQVDSAVLEPRLRDADLVLGCSEFIAQNVRDVFPQFSDRCRSLYNGVDLDQFSPDDEPVPGGKDDIRRILFVGRVSPEKGLHVLLEAFKRVYERFPNTQVEIVGPDGTPPREFIVALSQDSKVSELSRFYDRDYRSHLSEVLPGDLANRVSFRGNVPYAELVRLYRRADVFVFPSVWDEPFGMPNIEAMACGVPVVATAGGGIPELVEHGKTGLLVERNNAVELANAILSLLEDESLRKAMGEAGRTRVAERFTWQCIADELLRQYATIASRAGAVTTA